ncbi:flagellar basal-body rod modification protein FlgD [Desulfitispora alkaliphila]|uniref:flagellar hook capping FlgD N-terminal domain-containing protein n=1 Tax=Desulfitispora alkaliphila TaxID=622674 RepID=UPI003D205BE4
MRVEDIINSSNNSAKKQDKPNDLLGKDDFLKLLITQLRHQDPLSPVDDKEFIAQMAQFSALEQMQNLNEKMETLQEGLSSKLDTIAKHHENSFRESLVSQALNMVGKEATVVSNNGNIKGTVESVKFVQGVPNLVINGKEYGLGQVERVELSKAPEEEVEWND